jgi:hypothetical protein
LFPARGWWKLVGVAGPKSVAIGPASAKTEFVPRYFTMAATSKSIWQRLTEPPLWVLQIFT